jgi:hypothetical protein
MEAACESFLSRCLALNLAAGSVAWYRHILRGLRTSLGERGVRELGQVLPTSLRDHLSALSVPSHLIDPSFRPQNPTYLTPV